MTAAVVRDEGVDVAVVGMAGRFPGARDVDALWRNLRAGVDSIRHFSVEELLRAGVPRRLLEDADYVRAKGFLEDVDRFDAAFFGVTPRQAEILDPQHRLLLECAWHALEHAGCDPARSRGRIGVFAGCSPSSYLLRNLIPNRTAVEAAGQVEALLGNDKDYLTTRLSYLLDLTGPSLAVQTACSTSLVAVHVARHALLGYQCDLALAGGVSVSVPSRSGYLYQEGGILSPDGRCRPFDARARGTVNGNGVGLVALKRLEDALADGDTVLAVIRGSAANNDGARKVGFTAPSVDAQAMVIAEAQAVAEVAPATVSYVEAHGTATPLGDPIEVAALHQAFRGVTGARRCALGSVKGNLGHLDAAAGVAGLIKTVLALGHREIPPSLHFESPNPEIDFEAGPFFVNDRLRPWPAADGAPRLAGVSSFGIGGTNCHVVLEEPPAPEEPGPARETALIVISAKTTAALEESARRTAAALAGRSPHALADAAFTLAVGRGEHRFRRAAVGRSGEELAAVLTGAGGTTAADGEAGDAARRGVAFLFPGQGAQVSGMGRELYAAEPAFRAGLDRCFAILEEELGEDPRPVIWEPGRRERLRETRWAQPLLVAIEWALAELWRSWGVRPAALIGHSVGEFTAACLAGTFEVEDAIRLVAERGRLMSELPPGGMLLVPLAEAEVGGLIERLDPGGERLALAAVNGPESCVVAGSAEAVAALEDALDAAGEADHRRLEVSHAFHSPMMEPILDAFGEAVGRRRLRPPSTPWISNLTGRPIRADEAVDPAYWVRHLRRTVRFADGLDRLLAEEGMPLLEVGPGRTLTTLARWHPRLDPGRPLLTSMPAPGFEESEDRHLRSTLGRLWAAGAPVDHESYYRGERRRRVPLPGYPFESRRYWIDPPARPDADPIPQETERNPMTPTTPAARPTAAPARRERIAQRLRDSVAQMLGVAPEDLSLEASFLELGADSLLLLRFNRALNQEFGLKFPFRRLLEDLATLDALAGFVDRELPADAAVVGETSPAASAELSEGQATDQPPEPQAEEEPEPQPRSSAPPPARPASPRPATAAPAPPARAAAPPSPAAGAAPVGTDAGLQRILDRQLELMASQLELLRAGAGTGAPAAPPPVVQPPAPPEVEAEPAAPAPPAPAAAEPARSASARDETEVYVPYRPVQKGSADGLTDAQRAHVADLVERVSARTAGSKRVAASYRPVLADSRTLAGFRMLWKELKYPLVGERGEGSRLWDVDGNEYVDFAMGFGALLFGHSPPFLQRALHEQLDRGMVLGAESEYAGRAARLITELTGCERVAFTNSGTEAVMSALRLARLATGRHKVALFEESYHGTFDGVMVRGEHGDDGRLRAVPLAPGVPKYMADEVVILRFDDPRSLPILEECAGELAAILVEPPQSRRPERQPQDFLRALRRIADRSGATLVFDEVVTGFRFHPGGAQRRFDIQADLVTYGKAMSGGLPVAALAGKARYLDGIDGGAWGYGDDSSPDAEITFFAGTYFRHPLLMRALHAALSHMQEQGTALQDRLDRLTARLEGRVNPFFESAGIPLRLGRLGSLFRFQPIAPAPYLDLFYYELLDRGIYICETRNCFVSTAHEERDVDRLAECVEEAASALCRAGLLPGDPPEPGGGPGGGRRPRATAAATATTAAGPTGAGAPVTALVTEAQKDIWLLCQQGEDASRAFHQSVTLELTGDLDLEALRRALETVVERHEALRTTFDEDGELQRIHPRPDLELPLIDLAAAEPADRGAACIAAAAARPFDLAGGPLVRALLVRLGPDRHRLSLTLHHAVADGWSLGLVLAETAALYSAARRGEPARLPEPMQLREYAEEQRRRQQRQAADDEQFWSACFAGVAPVVELPADRPRPPVQSYRGGRVRRRLEGELAQRLRDVSRRLGATPFNCLLAAFQTLVHRLTGQQDVVIGIPAAGQSSADNPHLVGHCVNLLPLRSRMTPALTFEEAVRRTAAAVLDAYEHQDYPFRAIVRQLGVRRDPSRLPLVDVVFNLDQGGVPRFAGLEVEAAEAPAPRLQWDLSWNLRDEAEALAVECDYNADLFDGETVERWIDAFAVLTAAAAAEPGRPLSRLPLVGPGERARLAPAPAPAPAPAGCLHELFARRAASAGDAPAVIAGGRKLSYRRLEQRAHRLARHLRRRGVRPGAVVALCFEPSAEMVVAILATLEAGAAYLPLDPSHPPERLAFVARDAGASAAVCRGGLPFDPGADVAVIDVEAERRRIQRHDAGPVESGAGPGHPAYVIYTSGSTGRPKGVLVSHANVVRLFTASEELFGFGERDVWTLFHSYGFDFSVWEIWGALLYGGRLVVVPRDVSRSPADFLRLLEEERVTVLNQTPSAFQQLLRYRRSLDGDDPELALRLVVFGGEALRPRDLAPWFERYGDAEPRLVNMYGITETTVHVSFRPLTAADAERAGSPIGGALPDLSMPLLDRALEPVPAGVAGEIHVGGAGVAIGYLGRPRLTAERFVPDPFSDRPGTRLYRSGDLARRRTDGDVEYLGRRDLQVKIRGFRVEAGEIESALAEHPRVRRAVVAARGEVPGEQRLVAWVVPDEPGSVTAAELRGFLAERLPDYMHPAAYVELAELPLNANGKVDRDALPADGEGRLRPATPHVEPAGEVERTLCRILAEVLGEPRVGLDDNFFELGGDSILAMQMVVRAKPEGLRFSVRDVFQAQTAGEMARRVERSEPAGRPRTAAAPAERPTAAAEETAPLTPIQHWFFEQELADPHHWNMSLTLESREAIDPARLRDALDLVAERHAAVRLRFAAGAGGRRQSVAAAGASALPLDHRRVDAADAGAADRALAEAGAEWQRSLDLERGPIARVGLLDLGPRRPGRLVLALHHLAVDVLSRRVLLADLTAAYEQLGRSGRVELPPATTPYLEWARRLAAHAGSPGLEREAELWLDGAVRRAAPLPVDARGGENTEGSARVVTAELDAEETDRLLHRVPAVLKTQVLDALLAALVRAVEDWTGDPVLRVDLEGHGREELFDDVDVTATVGWFTAIYPAVLDLGGAAAMAEAVAAVRDQRRRIRDGGIGYGLLRYLRDDDVAHRLAAAPEAEIAFNFLGRAGGGAATGAAFEVIEGGGEGRSPRARRRHLLEVNGGVVDGRLRTMWRYSENRHRRSTVERLAGRFHQALRELAAELERNGAPAALLPPRMDRATAERLVARAEFES